MSVRALFLFLLILVAADGAMTSWGLKHSGGEVHPVAARLYAGGSLAPWAFKLLAVWLVAAYVITHPPSYAKRLLLVALCIYALVDTWGLVQVVRAFRDGYASM